MERVSGRFGGFVRVGQATLRLLDLDEALFPVPGLLNYSMTVAEDEENGVVEAETQMLTGEDETDLIQGCIRTISSIQNMTVKLPCQYNPREAGSLRKRGIVDRRRERLNSL